MSAELLRRAAALMRERAKGAHRATEVSGVPWYPVEQILGKVVWAEDAEHIASWHPAVALAVADWLDATATRIDAGRDPQHGGRRNHSWRGSREALAVARAYLDSGEGRAIQ